jgi:YD repeat-containing protein
VRERFRRFDALGRVIREAGPVYSDPDAGNAQRRQVTLYVWDGLSRLARVQAGYCAYSASSGTGCSGSDVVSELVSRVHDELGRTLSERRVDSTGAQREWRYTHDVHGNVLTATDAKGQLTTYSWGYGHQLERSVAQGGHVSSPVKRTV